MNESEEAGGTPPPSPATQPAFPEPTFTPPGWQPPVGGEIDAINARPHVMQGAYWVSFDRQHWWNGTAWIPGSPPGQSGPTTPTGMPGGMSPVAAIVGLIGFVVFAIFALGVCTSMQQQVTMPGGPMP